MSQLKIEKSPGLSERGGVCYFINEVPEQFKLTHKGILQWEEAHGGLYHWFQRIQEDGYLPKFAEVRDILVGAHLQDDMSTASKEQTKRLFKIFEPEHYLQLSEVAFMVVAAAFTPEVSNEEDSDEDLKKK